MINRLVSSPIYGSLLVASAALLWGTDSIFRYPIADKVDSTLIVFAEHALGVLGLLPLIWFRSRKGIFKLQARDWLTAIFVGAFGSAVATTLFTESFRFVNPSIAVLLQKLQPVLVVCIAYVALQEKPRPRFYLWAVVALAAGVVLSFPDLKFDFSGDRAGRGRGVWLAGSAAILWAASTVAGKVLSASTSASVATFWRYLFGLVTITVMLVVSREPVHWGVVSQGRAALSVVYVSFLSGIVPMVLYYAGLARTRAGVATFVELLFPISSVVLNTLVLGMPLSGVQLAAGAVLMVAVTMISL